MTSPDNARSEKSGAFVPITTRSSSMPGKSRPSTGPKTGSTSPPPRITTNPTPTTAAVIANRPIRARRQPLSVFVLVVFCSTSRKRKLLVHRPIRTVQSGRSEGTFDHAPRNVHHRQKRHRPVQVRRGELQGSSHEGRPSSRTRGTGGVEWHRVLGGIFWLSWPPGPRRRP